MLLRFDYPAMNDGLIEELFNTDYLPSYSKFPAMNISEKENEIVITAEIPGVKKENVKITYENNVLNIAGERKPYEIPESARVLLNEVRVRDFNRSVELDHEIDRDRISAELTDGILTVVLPKAEKSKARIVELK